MELFIFPTDQEKSKTFQKAVKTQKGHSGLFEKKVCERVKTSTWSLE
ncbi:MAG: hypothetical protein IM631_13065 [Cytophagales bacterium]|nr:hypothetical protein [Cytophagales bacterium]MCA6372303.1 hypothetical protein [Cytophagales bacterium]MCA6382449.1 hypothetical protein [Cytophagales bacterium]